jgi:hypothetical protein
MSGPIGPRRASARLGTSAPSSFVALAAVFAAAGAAACDLGKKVTSQSGYRGTGMNQVYDSSKMFGKYGLVKIPTTLPPRARRRRGRCRGATCRCSTTSRWRSSTAPWWR